MPERAAPAAPHRATAPDRRPARRPSHVGPSTAPRHSRAGTAGPTLGLGAGAAGRGGASLSPQVAGPIARSLGVDVSGIRVHTGPNAAAATRSHGALAFALGNDIFLGAGQSPTDLAVMSHEVAHVVQQRGAPRVQLWTPSGGDRYEREAGRAAAAVSNNRPFTVVERSPAAVQTFGISDAKDYLADHANVIPGFRLFTVVIGFNPITGARVERSGANILRGLIEILPLGSLVTQALDKYGILDKVGAWVEQQFHTLGDIGAEFKQALDKFLDTLGAGDLVHPGAALDRGISMIGAPVRHLFDFGLGLITGIVGFVKDAILRPLAEVAKGTSGWDLLCAVLRQDPITGDEVERNADTLIGGFMKLIGQQEVWENLKKSNAAARAWAWFQGALEGLLGFVRSLPGLFLEALHALQLSDLLDLFGLFGKLGKIFGTFAGKFFSWAGDQVLQLLQIIFEVVAPGAIPYIKKAGAAFKSIIKNPVGFLGNLVKAGLQGFTQFGKNFLGHLKNALLSWLKDAIGAAGIYIPTALELREIVKFVLSILGLTWDNIRVKLLKVIPEPVLQALETGFDIVKKLITEGPAAAWEAIKDVLSDLKNTVIEGIIAYVTKTVVVKAVAKLISGLNPVGAFVQAVLTIYDTIMTIVAKIKEIAQILAAFIDSMSAIANGQIAAAANKVESVMSGLLNIVIAWLARFASLGKIGDKIKEIVAKVRAPVDKALDKVIDWVVAAAKKAGKLFGGKGDKDKPTADPAEKAGQVLAGKLGGSVSVEDAQKAVAATFAEVRPLGVKSLTLVPEGDNFVVEVVASPKKKLTMLERDVAAAAMQLDAVITVEDTIDLRKEPMVGANIVRDPRTGLSHASTHWAPIGAGDQDRWGAAINVGGLAASPQQLRAVARNTTSKLRRENGSHAERALAAFISKQPWMGSILEIRITNAKLSPCKSCAGELKELLASINAERKRQKKAPLEKDKVTLDWKKPYLTDPALRGKSPALAAAYINEALAAVGGWKVTPASIAPGDANDRLVVKAFR